MPYANGREYWLDLAFLFIILILVLILAFTEYTDHDCIPGKRCSHYVEEPSDSDSINVSIDRIISMAKNNHDYITWRQSLLVAIIFSVLVVFYLKGRLPTVLEWLGVSVLIFLGTYLSFSWIWAHFCYPNGKKIEANLFKLKDRLYVNDESTQYTRQTSSNVFDFDHSLPSPLHSPT